MRAVHPVDVGRAAHAAQRRPGGRAGAACPGRADLRVRGHRLDQPVGHVAGEGIHDANPIDAGARRASSASSSSPGRPSAPGRGRNRSCPARSGSSRARRPSAGGPRARIAAAGAADRRAFDQRDGAEGARAAAAVGDLEIGAGALHRGPQRALLDPSPTVAASSAGGRRGSRVPPSRAGRCTTSTMSIQRRVPMMPSMPGTCWTTSAP